MFREESYDKEFETKSENETNEEEKSNWSTPENQRVRGKSKKPKASPSKNGPKRKHRAATHNSLRDAGSEFQKKSPRRAGGNISRKRKGNETGGCAAHLTDPTEPISVKCMYFTYLN